MSSQPVSSGEPPSASQTQLTALSDHFLPLIGKGREHPVPQDVAAHSFSFILTAAAWRDFCALCALHGYAPQRHVLGRGQTSVYLARIGRPAQ